ncbi:MAG: hypothetical protein MUP90_00340, partial [Gammaproteobacteria bacterium]|nr:hypothetical protein [Gammaproteobacteria bacterium]
RDRLDEPDQDRIQDRDRLDEPDQDRDQDQDRTRIHDPDSTKVQDVDGSEPMTKGEFNQYQKQLGMSGEQGTGKEVQAQHREQVQERTREQDDVEDVEIEAAE